MKLSCTIAFSGFLVMLSLCFACSSGRDGLYDGFLDPPSQARPFVRWWWNGNRITEKEIERQLDILKSSGIGGVEINPIEMPSEGDTTGTNALKWISPEWNRMLAFASKEASSRGMITDLIVGSGWPFGGEFLSDEETLQGVIINSIESKKGITIEETLETLTEKAIKAQSRAPEGIAHSSEALFIRMVPDDIKDTSEVEDLMNYLDPSGTFRFTPDRKNCRIIYGILQHGTREVMHGAPGAAGPVMDHYRKEVTRAYLSRLLKISEDTGIPLSKLIRALFCDSIELAGANWSEDFTEIFFKDYGYRPEPYYPFIFYEPYKGYQAEQYNDKFADELMKVRYDYNRLLVKTFLNNFTREFQQFCTENGLKCRYQAYGTPFLMGMMEGNMIPDIPESNNWLFSGDNMNEGEWNWNQGHGYMIWNLYAASGGHLTGREIISVEAMTNTRGVFRASLGDIKRHDDMNFISGMNHSVLHGYNYSPLSAGFPGWIRFGEYFSEQNTWWPYFKYWADYNARLSYIFQKSKPVKEIAILGPTGDIWSMNGLPRVPFHMEPWYCYRLWESLSQCGSSCDYIGENIIREGTKTDGKLSFGPMSYGTIILCNVRSVESETALALKEFAECGGKIVFVETVPYRSLSLVNSEINDSIVQASFSEIKQNHSDRVVEINGPDSPERLLDWTEDLLNKNGIVKGIQISTPDRNLYQIHKVYDDRDIWFFVNPNSTDSVHVKVSFPDKGRTPWIWDPEDGSRCIFPYAEDKSELEIELAPFQSLLLVFDTLAEGDSKVFEKPEQVVLKIQGPWQTEFIHTDGSRFVRSMNSLKEFGTKEDSELQNFAGTVKYLTEFESDGRGRWLRFENVNKGITEVYINGKKAGLNWYGLPVFSIDKLQKKGRNRIEIVHTTLLSNYVMSLRNNPPAERWSAGYQKMKAGIDGNVMILN
jgi:hypothetical protein